MTLLQSIVHRRLLSGKMNTKPGADRWSSPLSVLTPLQMVNFAIFCLHYTFLIAPPHRPLSQCTFLWPPSDYQWFHTLRFAVQPFDHNAITCYPDLIPSLWSILCGSKNILSFHVFMLQSAFVSNFATRVSMGSYFFFSIVVWINIITKIVYAQSESFILMCAIKQSPL